jgi:multidrug efflux pump subunit AcrA (membrane-fusion protein)
MDTESWSRFGFTLALALAVAALAPMGRTAANEIAPDSPCDLRCILVEVTLVKAEAYAPKVALTGGIEPRFSNNIAFRISGRIDQRVVEIGDHITAGQVLAQVDPQVQRANLDTAKAGLVSAQALLTQANLAFERQVALFKSGFTTRPAHDQARQQLQTQEAAVESAKAALGTAESSSATPNSRQVSLASSRRAMPRWARLCSLVKLSSPWRSGARSIPRRVEQTSSSAVKTREENILSKS